MRNAYWRPRVVVVRRWCVAMAIVILFGLIVGCSDSRVASRNLSKAADQFEITRRVVFYNGITGEFMLEIVGRCSIKADGRDAQLEVTCRKGEARYVKHFLGLSDNVTYFAEQLSAEDVSVYRYRVLFKPSAILPDVDLLSGWSDG